MCQSSQPLSSALLGKRFTLHRQTSTFSRVPNGHRRPWPPVAVISFEKKGSPRTSLLDTVEGIPRGSRSRSQSYEKCLCPWAQLDLHPDLFVLMLYAFYSSAFRIECGPRNLSSFGTKPTNQKIDHCLFATLPLFFSTSTPIERTRKRGEFERTTSCAQDTPRSLCQNFARWCRCTDQHGRRHLHPLARLSRVPHGCLGVLLPPLRTDPRRGSRLRKLAGEHHLLPRFGGGPPTSGGERITTIGTNLSSCWISTCCGRSSWRAELESAGAGLAQQLGL